tara:strand:- start:96 stop:461 length:366 start_codon:yes stop_codon:yes gene_type:complete
VVTEDYRQQMLDQVVEVEHLLQVKMQRLYLQIQEETEEMVLLTQFLVHCLKHQLMELQVQILEDILQVVVLVEVVFPLLLELMDLVEMVVELDLLVRLGHLTQVVEVLVTLIIQEVTVDQV